MNQSNPKETVLIFGGNFWDNGVTTALINTLEAIDLTKRNYIVAVGQNQIKPEHEFRIRNLPAEITFYPFPEQLLGSPFDLALLFAYAKFEWLDAKWIRSRVERVVKKNFKRLFGALEIDHLIHFTGFGSRFNLLTAHAPVGINKIIYVHTDMAAEYEAKDNINKKIALNTYASVDKIALVHKNLASSFNHFTPGNEKKLHVMNNFLGKKRIVDQSHIDLELTLEDVQMEHGNMADLVADLNDDKLATFINIGRFDYEKGHDRLISVFEDVYQENQHARLIIVAPHGPLKEKTLAQINQSSAKGAIYVLGRMGNPYALLKSADCFVLSSYYEGLGLVVYEALAVGTDVITVNLAETTEYLQNNEALIVENSEAGLADGMRKYLAEDLAFNPFDFDARNRVSLEEFEALFETH